MCASEIEGTNLAQNSKAKSIDIPKAIRQALRVYKCDAVREMQRYISAFDAKDAHDGLVQMSTGSGKTSVIATPARCETRFGHVIIIAPTSVTTQPPRLM